MPAEEMVGKKDHLAVLIQTFDSMWIGEGTPFHGEDGFQDILETVQKLRSRMQDEGDTVEPLNNILCDKSMQALLKVHEKVRPIEEHRITEPVVRNSTALVQEIHSAANTSDYFSHELDELCHLFISTPHLRALLQCHDQIASKDFEPELPEAEPNDSMMGDEEESMKVVRLVKGNEPLGATIAVDELTDNIVIARILKGGAADRSGLIHVNDILVEVNKVPARGKKPEELIKLLADFRGPLTFRLIPGESSIYEEDSEPVRFVRAKFNYYPERDRLIPCPEAGLMFRKNDVLRIVSRDDESWWQASIAQEGLHTRNFNNIDGQGSSYYRVRAGDHLPTASTNRAGLIPSTKLQTRRETLRRQATVNYNNNAVKGSSSSLTSRDRRERRSAWNLLRQSFRRSNRRLDQSTPSPDHSKYEVPAVIDPSTVIPYKEVVLLPPVAELPKENRFYRPIVLIGPQGVGRNELKDRLIDSNPTHYGVPVPHTSRSKLEDEEDGKDYHFVTREFMEHGIRENMFLEYGEYKGNLYGTSLDAVKTVTQNQQVCVLTPYPQALKVLRSSDLKPFVIFIKPPALDKLAKSDELGNAAPRAKQLTIDRDVTAPFSTEELCDLVSRGNKMENSFGHWFDHIVVNDGVDRAFMEVKQVTFAVENDAQWVPKEWISTSMN